MKEDRIYSQSPSRFPIYTSYGEGWALYSESLGFDMGLYDDLMDRWGGRATPGLQVRPPEPGDIPGVSAGGGHRHPCTRLDPGAHSTQP